MPIPKINFSPDVISQLEDDELCRICFANKLNPSDTNEKLECGHNFCKLCIENHLTIRISNGHVNFLNN